MIKATEETLTGLTYNKEPGTEGTFYTLDLDELKARGIRYIEIHFPDWEEDDQPTDPNMVRFLDEDGN